MIPRRNYFVIVGVIAILFASSDNEPGFAGEAGDREFTKDVAPVLKTYCVGCHSGDEPKAGLALDVLGTDFAEHVETWNAVRERLADRTMPPKGKPQPTADERRVVAMWVEAELTSDAKRQTAMHGRARLRRLSRVEYVNTMRDLLGAEIDPERLPEDGIASGFDNVDAALDISAALLESYLETIDIALDAVLVRGPAPESTTRRIDLVSLAKQLTKTNRPMPRFGISTRIREDEIVFFSAAMASKPVIDAKASESGLYRFRISANSIHTGREMTLLIYTGNYGRGVQGLFTRPVVLLDIPEERTVVEFTVPLALSETIRLVPHGMPNVYDEVADDYAGPGLAAQWIEVQGPITDAWPPKPTARLLGDVDLDTATLADAQDILRRFATRAFRRPVDDSELTVYVDLLKSRLANGYSIEAALRVGLKAVLCSPSFIYLYATPGELDDFQLATRLSYFLWSTMPDDALLESASRGELNRPDVLRQQVERMLSDPRSHAFTENFVGQWLSLRNLMATIPDKKLYPDFDEFLQFSMPLETYGFFEEILRENRPVLEFWNADWSLLNERLATLYGVPDVRGSAFRKVSLPADSHRGGVLTQAAVLKVTANGTNTSPVVRGAWVLDHLLGDPAPPPPKDVPAIEPDIRGAKTMREQLAKHRQIDSCATCHTKIDPIGNALENFDVIGGWREFYRVVPEISRTKVKIPNSLGREVGVGQGLPVDAADELSDGRKFTNVDELKRLVLTDAEPLARAMTEKLLVYATGHRLEFADRETVTAILTAAKQSDYGFRTLIHELVQSPVFRNQ